MLRTKTHVIRKVWTTYSRENPPGSGYCDEHHDRQYLVRDYFWYGIRIWRNYLDSEDVPLFVSIQLATTGITDWKSKFAEVTTDD